MPANSTASGGLGGAAPYVPPAGMGGTYVAPPPPPGTTGGFPAVVPPVTTGGSPGISSGGAVSAGGAPVGSTGGAGSGGDGNVDPPVPPGGECLNDITNYGAAGPFQVTQRTVGAVKFWVPGVPAGCKVPVVHLANGTGATCGTYGASLTRLATHGFLACCYENANTGAGTQGMQALESALTTFPDLADYRFGSTGHSQGGMASFVVVSLAEAKWGDKGIYAGLAMQPASGFGQLPAGGWERAYAAIKSPMFMFAGAGSDGLVSQSWVQSAFNAMNDATEAYFWIRQGSRHIPVPNGEEMQISIPWFRWKLLGDQKACAAFKGILTTDRTWSQVGVQNEQACQ